MLNSESQKRSNERLKALHNRKKKYERIHSNPIRQKQPDDWDSIQQERYKTLIENVPCALYSASPGKTGPTTFMSNKWKDWTGYLPEELYQNPEAWPKCIHPDDREKAVDAYSRACQDNVPYKLEYRIVHRQTEQVRYVIDQGLLSKDKKGDIIRVDGIITDISELKRAEKSQRESEERFQIMFEKLPNVSVQGYGPDGTVHYWNKANESIFGYTADEAIGKNLMELIIPPEMREYVHEVIAHGVSTGEMPAAAELNLMRKDGSRVPVWSSHAVVRHAGKEPELFCINVGLRELEHAEKKLRESEERFKNIFNNAPVGLYRITPDGRILMANPALIRMLGYNSFEELTNRNLKQVGSRPRYFRSEFKKRIENEGRIIGFEADWVRRDGTILSVRESAKAIRDEHRNILYYEGTVEDTTERKQVEEELAIFQKFAEASEQAFGMADLEGSITYANPTLCRILGVKRPQDICGTSVTKYYLKEDLPILQEEVLPAVIESGHREVEMPLLSVEGKITPSIQSIFLIRDERGEPLLLANVITDITERKHAEEQLKRHGDHLEEMIAIRTRELEQNNAALQKEITERRQTEEALKISELRFRSLIEQTTDAVFCYEYEPPIPTDLPVEQQVRLLYDGVLVECNDICAKSYGADRAEEVIGKRLTELFGTAPGSLDELFTEMIEGGYRTVDGEGVKRFEDGTEKYYLNNGHGIIEDGRLVRVWGTFREITERKKSEETLRETTNLLETIFEHTHMLVACLDSQFNFVRVNRAYAEADEREPSFFPGKNHFDLYPNEENEVIFRRVIETGIPYFAYAKPFEYAGHPERGISYWDWSLVPIKNQQGIVSGLILTLADVTARKRTEEALKESEEKFRSLAEHSPNMIFINKKGKVVYANEKCEKVIGYKREELYSPDFDFRYLIAPESLGLVNDKFEEHLRNEEVRPYDYCLINKKGERIEAINASKLVQYEGETAILGVVTDITERKKAERALRESEERLKILFESAPDAIYLIDSEGRIVDGNRAALKLIGFPKDEVIGRTLGETGLLSGEQLSRAEANLKEVVSGRLSGPNEYTLTRKDGSQVSVEVRTFPVKIEGKMLTLGIARDITMHKQTEEELLEHQAKLKSLASQLSLTEERERHRLATDLHDQISQSLVISKIKLDQLRKSSTSDEFSRPLKDICKCLGQIIDDTRALTFDLSYPILYELGFEAAVAEWLSDQIQEKHQIKTEFEDDGQQKPLDDDIRVLLFRNVRELLINVIKHAKANKVRVSIRRNNEYINVRVEDDGIGFDPVEVTSMAAKRAEFGLFSIRERLEQLGGMIEIDSEPGCGSRITMRAPLKYNSSTDRISK